MISVIIPTLNEKKNIKRLCGKLNSLSVISEVIFVDDNSPDGTYQEIKKVSVINRKFKGILRKDEEKNLSASILAGTLSAKNKLVLVMDADLQHNIKYILKMNQLFQRSYCDIVVASRFAIGNIAGNLGFIRSILSRLCILMVGLFFKKKTSDPLSGFFLCNKNLITKEYKKFYLKGFKILFDILYNGKKNIKCVDFPIIFEKRKDEKSKFNLKIIIIFIKQLIFTLKK